MARLIKTRARGHTAYGAHSLSEDNRYKAAYRATARALMRCQHTTKRLEADGNTFRCTGCDRVVGFMRLPTRSRD